MFRIIVLSPLTSFCSSPLPVPGPVSAPVADFHDRDRGGDRERDRDCASVFEGYRLSDSIDGGLKSNDMVNVLGGQCSP
jgi:hypothetical protein